MLNEEAKQAAERLQTQAEQQLQKQGYGRASIASRAVAQSGMNVSASPLAFGGGMQSTARDVASRASISSRTSSM